MSEVEELEQRIRKLSKEELAVLRNWFYEFQNEMWDRQIEADHKAGRFDELIQQARQEFAEGKTREL